MDDLSFHRKQVWGYVKEKAWPPEASVTRCNFPCNLSCNVGKRNPLQIAGEVLHIEILC